MDDITLNVGLQPGDIQNTAEALRKEIEGIFDSTSGTETSTSFKSLQNSLSKAYNNAGKLIEQMKKLAATDVPTEAFANLDKQYDELLAKLGQLDERKKRFLATGGKVNSSAFKRMDYDIKQVNDEINAVLAQMQQLRQAGPITTPGTETAEYANLARQLNDINNQITILKQKAQESGEIPPVNLGFLDRAKLAISNFMSAIRSVPERLQMIARNALNAAAHLPGIVAGKVIRGLKNIAVFAGNAAVSLAKMAGQGILAGIKKLGSAMMGLNKQTKSSHGLLQTGFKKFVQYGLGVRTVFLLIKKLRSAFIEGLGNLSQYSEPFNQTISSFLSSLATLKNSFAAAFAPIISVVAPILTYFLNMLNEVIAKVGEFLYAITGHQNFIVAKKANVDYAKSLDKSSKSADKASKATKDNAKAAEEYKKTIAGFDDVEILNDPDKDKSSDSSGSGADSGAGDAGELTGADMFETKPISSAMADFANKIRDFIKNQDWVGLGTFLGQSINSIFAKAQKMISWETLGNKITFIVTAITTTLNSLVSAVDWDLIGRTFATGVNTIIYTLQLLLGGIDWYAIGNAFATGLNGFLTNIDWVALGNTLGLYINAWIHTIQGFVENFKWDEVGLNLAGGLNSLVQTIDWAGLGTTVSTALSGALNFLASAIENFDWYQLGVKIQTFLVNIDWGRIASALFRALGAALGGLTAFLWGLIEQAWNNVITYWYNAAFKDGQFTISGLLKGILDGFANIGQWVYDHIMLPFINGFKKAFRISSPSKLMQDMGKYIIEGLKDGLTNTWHNIANFFTDKIAKIKSFFTEGKWKELGGDVVGKLKDGLGLTDVWETITSTFSGGVEKLKGFFDADEWETIGSDILDGIKDGIDSGWNWLSNTVGNLATDLLNRAEQELGIASPSKVFRDAVGKMIPAGLAEGILDDQNLAINAVVNMSDAVQNGAIKNLQIPAVVKGEVIPYSVKYSGQEDANSTLNRVADMLEYSKDNGITIDDLREILIDVIQDYLNFTFMIGDEQLARHVNSGNAKLNRRFSTTKLSIT